jgi:iron donor protein CyaY
MDEQEYRRKVQTTLDKIERAFTDVDPDVAECEQSLGSLTVTSADRSRLILSSQPSVRQVWLALAAKGIAHHFNWASDSQWIDDKGKGIELLAFLKQYFKESADLDLNFK